MTIAPRSSSSDVAFSPAVKRIQEERGSRGTYARIEAAGGFHDRVDERLRAFLAEIDTAFLATASADGQPYVQHRGGPRGFIRALDERTIGLLDHAGNRQYVSTGNLSENDRVCLILVDYARRRRVKIWGRARVVPLDPEIVARLAVPGHVARSEQAFLVEVTAWDINCPQHIPQKLDAAEVAIALERLDARIRDLEADNARLRASAADVVR
jgi:predicted pyridoxine 5'-phosphate oxidase superfamily flavin-nucleotide-binding protein